jgi:hypothetical protein
VAAARIAAIHPHSCSSAAMMLAATCADPAA